MKLIKTSFVGALNYKKNITITYFPIHLIIPIEFFTHKNFDSFFAEKRLIYRKVVFVKIQQPLIKTIK